MKYLAYIFLAITLFISSCEDYLETDSPSAFTDDYIFSNEDDAFKAISSVYQTFTKGSFDQIMSTYYSCNTDLENGHVHEGTDNSRRDIWSYRATSSNSSLLGPWNNSYLGINRANECIEGIQLSEMYDQGNKKMKHMLGEALAIRAFYYYYLVNYWGDIPFKTTATKAGDEFYLPRTSRDTILSHVIRDLMEIEPEMYWADQLPQGIERISRDFVIGLIAKLSLTRGGYALRQDGTMRRPNDYTDYYEIANTYCKKLINLKPRTLDPDFQQMFKNQCEYIVTSNQDIIFEIPYMFGNGDIGWNLGLRVDGGSHGYGTGNNFINFPPTYYHSFDTTDTRLPVSCALFYYDKDLKKQPIDWIIFISTHKWSRTWLPMAPGATSAKGTGINWPVLRYADVLLMLAETENEIHGQPTQVAKDALAKVRRRAFPQELWNEKVDVYIQEKATSKESFFNALVDERAWEFGGECIRKFDLIRWNLLGQKIAETRAKLKTMAEDATKGTGEYAHLPDYLYYKRKSNGDLVFYNKFEKPEELPPLKDVPNIGDNPEGYEQIRWLVGLWGQETDVPDDYMDIQWSGYPDETGETPVPYILPIHATIINNSRGILNNDGYLLNY